MKKTRYLYTREKLKPHNPYGFHRTSERLAGIYRREESFAGPTMEIEPSLPKSFNEEQCFQ